MIVASHDGQTVGVEQGTASASAYIQVCNVYMHLGGKSRVFVGTWEEDFVGEVEIEGEKESRSVCKANNLSSSSTDNQCFAVLLHSYRLR